MNETVHRSDLATDITTHRSVSCIIYEYNQVTLAWKANKQCGVSHNTNEVETRAFFKAIKRRSVCRRFFESLGMPITYLTSSYEDNNATIQQKLTPIIKHMDIMMLWLHEEYALETYVAVYCNIRQNKADLNTKSLGGETLQIKHLWSVGFQLYPPNGTDDHKLLELHRYNIGMHGGSFLLDRSVSTINDKK